MNHANSTNKTDFGFKLINSFIFQAKTRAFCHDFKLIIIQIIQ